MSDLHKLSILELKNGLASKDFSAVELTESLLNRISNEDKLNSFISVTPEVAIAEAEKADQRLKDGDSSRLLGIPIGLKDIILKKGMPSTAGSKILENFDPPYNATVSEKVAAAGGVVVGKNNCDQFAMGSSNENSAFGPVCNPWSLDRVPGGTSGGSAAAVAAQLIPASLGTDTGGSVRQPGSFCNVVALKPTYGRVSRYGVTAFASSLDQVGAMTRTVADCALVTEVICGHDPLDSTSVEIDVPDFSAALGESIAGLRVGIPKEYFISGLDSEVELAVKTAIEQLSSLGAEVVDVSLPHTESAVPAYYIIAPAEASSNLARYDGIRYGHRASDATKLEDVYAQSRAEGFGPEVKRRILIGTYVLSKGYYDAYYRKAQRVRTLIANDFKDVFADRCDLIACPVAPTTAFKIGEKVNDPVQMYLSDVFTIPCSLAGLPGMSIPCGFDSTGLPIGLQLIGKPWDEATVLKAAYAYEQSTDWHKQVPNGFGD